MCGVYVIEDWGGVVSWRVWHDILKEDSVG